MEGKCFYSKDGIDSLTIASNIALSYYPELQNLRIYFVRVKKGIFPYSCRPSVLSVFRKKKYRKYYIYLVAPKSAMHSGIYFDQLPAEAQIGILGHEIGHIVRYHQSNIFELIRDGLFYFWPSFRVRYERDTDKICIYHGLGQYLLEYCVFVRAYIQRTETLKWVEKYYLSPEEIKQEILAVNQNDQTFQEENTF